MTTFNIGTQNAANIQNVGGDMVVEGGVQASAAWQTHELRNEIARAREELGRLPLSEAARSSVDAALTAAAADAGAPKPDRKRIADRLLSAARALKEAGALTNAATSLIEALRRAASLLGPVGATVLALL
jgi:hypothetical protein